MSKSCCHKKKKFDWLLWGSTGIITLSYVLFWRFSEQFMDPHLQSFGASIFELMNKMSWGLALGILFVGMLEKIPRETIVKILGKGGTLSGILRATGAGVLLDLCSHGILIVGMQLYKRGASLGQMVAFLVASPWNSLSLTLVLITLVGIKWTLALLVLSMIIAVISGLLFDFLVKKKVLPPNPNKLENDENISFGNAVAQIPLKSLFTPETFWSGLKGSRMILRWIFFGVILAALIRTFVTPEAFGTYFGPTLGGLGLTLLVATILEVCSEGSAPVAADILTRAGAPGNAFGFLMAGVSTDYTEIITLKEATGSWKISLFLPLTTLPQIILISYIMNQFA